MANLPETASFDAGIYKIETADPVIGGDETQISNKQAAGLANRTKYLKAHLDAAEADIGTIFAALAAPATTQAAGDDDTSLATTAFVHRNSGGYAIVNVAGGGNITLVSDDWGVAVIILVGARTGNGNIVFPTRGDRWMVANRTTGTGNLTCKTSAGAGVTVARGRSKSIWCDGTDILNEETDLASRPKVVSTATTLVSGDDVLVDFSGGVFALTLPATPSSGDQVKIRGNFATNNLTVNRNGSLVFDKTGTAVASNYVANRNNLSAVITYFVPATGSPGWLVTLG